jgi:hypothetical protein
MILTPISTIRLASEVSPPRESKQISRPRLARL